MADQGAEPLIAEKQCRFCPGLGTTDQLFTLSRIFEGTWEFAQPIYMCFVYLEKPYDLVPWEILWEVLWEYGVKELLLQYSGLSRLCMLKVRVVFRFSAVKSGSFPAGVDLCQRYALSLTNPVHYFHGQDLEA